ncbi:MAG: solute:sodium symporter family transporter [Planctomycetes bacterium]|nr:solute:sodium symporter family transporter [Planctomycetota bacterium]
MDTAVTLISFVIVTGLVALGTWLITRRRPEGDDKQGASSRYFLAGRSLGAVFICGSLLLTNLSTEQLIGLNGDAFAGGLHVMAWEVFTVISLVLMALFFLPRFLRGGIATIPQFLENRFDHTTQVICNLIFLVAYAFILLPMILYTGATGLGDIINIKALLGIESNTAALWLMVWLVGIIGSIYAIFGGLRAVAVSDTLNGVLLLVGGFLIVGFGLAAVGKGDGMMAGLNTLVTSNPERFNSIGGPQQAVPFSTLFTGVLLLCTFYWCTNQQIIQRAFAAKNLAEGQKGVLLTGALKLFGPLYLVLPGMIAFHLYAGQDLKPVNAYGTLVKDVLPAPLTGFFLAAIVGAVLSSFNSALNSTATLFSLGIYKGILRKDASEEQVVASGKWFALVMAVAAMCGAPLLAGQESIFGFLQKMNGMYFIPILSVVVVGLLFRRVPAIAAKIGLLGSFLVIAMVYFVPFEDFAPALAEKIAALHTFHFLGLVFALSVATMVIIGLVKPRSEAWVQQPSGDVDLTPWRWAVPCGIALLVAVLAIYAWFADFAVLRDKPAVAAPVPETITPPQPTAP